MSVAMPDAELHAAQIVVRGDFNPAIFQPAWHAHHNLLPTSEAEGADVAVVHKELTRFTAGWMQLNVNQGAYIIETDDAAKFFPLRDLAIGTFRILSETPIKAFGFNDMRHVKLPSRKALDDVGHYFAPKTTWKNFLTEPGLRSMLVEGGRPEKEGVRIQIRLEPSIKVRDGLFIQVNQHYTVEKAEERPSSDKMTEMLQKLKEDWESFFEYCSAVSRDIVGVVRD